MTKKIIIVLLSVILCLGLMACSSSEDKDSQYTVTFYAQDGETVVTTMEVSDDRIVLPDAPEVEGYTFVGWYLDKPTSTIKMDAEFFMRNSASQNRNAYAKYEKDYNKLSFYFGEYLVNKIDIADERITLPDAPPNEHYTFEGWYLGSTEESARVLLTEDYFVKNPADGNNLKAFAKFTRIEYKLSFVVDGKVVDTRLISDKAIEFPEDPEAPVNQVFMGWYPANYKIAIKENYFATNPATSDMTVEARFEAAFKVTPTSIDTCTITGYIGTSKNVEIPKKITVEVNGQPVTYNITGIDKDAFKGCNIQSVVVGEHIESIGDNAFDNCKSLKTVEIAGSISKIGKNLFKGATAITDITAPISVVEQVENKLKLVNVTFNAGTKIASEMFKNSTSLRTVVFPEELEIIGSAAFAGCTSLKKIHIPASVTEIALDAFVDSYNLQTITVDADNANYTSGDDANCIVKIDNVVIMGAPDADGVQTPVGTEIVKTLIVACSNTKIFEGVNKITEYAFRNCKYLETLDIPSTVKEIPENAFVGAYNIEKITAADGNVNYKAIGNCLIKIDNENGNRLVLGCKKSEIAKDLDITSISKYAFANTDITSICIPMNVTSLEADSFKDCTKLEKVVIVNTELVFADDIFTDCHNFKYVEIPMEWLDYFRDASNKKLVEVTLTTGDEIAEGYFKGWTYLEKVTLCDSFKTIGAYAFQGATKLKTVVISETSELVTIGRYAFDGCTKFTAIDNGSKAGVFVVPETVTSIGDYAFRKTAIKALEFTDDYAIIIGYNAFANCGSIASVSIVSATDEVATIDFDAFAGCSSIATISSPALYVRIFSNVNNQAIKYLTITEGIADCYYIREMPNLKELYIGADVTSIDNRAFEGCSKLEKIEVAAENDMYSSVDNCLIYNKAVILGCLNSVIPTDSNIVTSIESYAFAQSNIAKIVIPENIYKINAYAFSACRNLKDITIGNPIISIVDKAFDGCDAVTNVKIPARAIKFISQVTITDVTITSGEIEANAFVACLTLKNVTIEPGVIVNYDAFVGCVNITNLTAPASALDKIPAEKVVTLYINDIEKDDTDNGIEIQITKATMAEYKNVKYITIKSSVKSTMSGQIDDDAFDACEKFTDSTIPAWAISKMPAQIVNITITAGRVEYVEGGAAKYVNLVKVTFTEDVTEIGLDAFKDYKALKTIVLTDSLINIRANAFNGCTALSSIDLSNVQKIGAGAFAGCTELKKIDISSVTEIGEGAFDGCTALTEATLPAFAMSYMPVSIKKLTIASGIVENFGTVVNTEKFKLPNLETVVLKNGVEIGENAFANATTLKSVTLPNTLTVIGKNAFYRCGALTTINLSNVTEIYENAFSGCSALQVVNLSNITKIGATAFSGCALRELNLPANIEIGKDAFLHCSFTKATVSADAIGYMPHSVTELVVLSGEILSGSLFSYFDDLQKLTIGAEVTAITAGVLPETINTITVDKNNEQFKVVDGQLINIETEEVIFDLND